MKKLGLLIVLVLGMSLAGCIDESSEVVADEPLMNAPSGGGGEDEDDPIPPPPLGDLD